MRPKLHGVVLTTIPTIQTLLLCTGLLQCAFASSKLSWKVERHSPGQDLHRSHQRDLSLNDKGSRLLYGISKHCRTRERHSRQLRSRLPTRDLSSAPSLGCCCIASVHISSLGSQMKAAKWQNWRLRNWSPEQPSALQPAWECDGRQASIGGIYNSKPY